MVAKLADGQRRDRREGLGVMSVKNQARHLVRLIGNQRFLQKRLERQIGQNVTGANALGVACRGDPGQFIAGTARRGSGEERLEICERQPLAVDRS